jgi:L-ascorbate metabolism protein UlaG (beta-lactamase superfamily)
MNHPLLNGVENLSHGDKVPFVISGPGEYEVGGVVISGFPSPKPVGEGKLLNTIYSIELEGIRLCILGALPTTELSPEIIEGIGEVDILFVPVSGGDVLSPADAGKIAVMLDAKLVIPVDFEDKNDKQLKAFLKEAGAEGVAPIDKLTLKKKDLDGKEGDVVLLEPLAHA